MAPTILQSWRDLIARGDELAARNLGSVGGPLAEADAHLTARSFLAKREDEDPGRGVLDPHDISNVGFFVLFAIIGVAFVVTGIWFFFWAKNGGFYFKENDWDDYKTTVLRRKGPNGTLLSGATESTNLGGGSVYKDVDDDTTTVVTESTALSGVTAGASDIVAREKRRKKQDQRDREREGRRRARGAEREKGNKNSRHVGDNGVEDDEAELKAKKELRNYRHERPARVGGLNKESDGSNWDGSTNPTESTVTSELLSNRQSTPTSSPAKGEKKGIRKVYSTAERNDQKERERNRAEARRLRDEGRTSRRDFSYQRSAVETESQVTESQVTESQATDSLLDNGTDLGTKSYHHPMPELRAQRQRDREERRARRGGYRRGRGEDEDDL